MGIEHTDQATRLIDDHPDQSHFRGGADDQAIAEAERALEVQFPPSYRQFLQTLGAGRFATQALFGVTGPRDNPALDVVARTLDQRQHGNLPAEFIIVGAYGREALFGFDCADRDANEECPVAEIPRDYSVLAEPNYFEGDFGSFLLARVCDELGEPRRFKHP